jgi:hypothetical protein
MEPWVRTTPRGTPPVPEVIDEAAGVAALQALDALPQLALRALGALAQELAPAEDVHRRLLCEVERLHADDEAQFRAFGRGRQEAAGDRLARDDRALGAAVGEHVDVVGGRVGRKGRHGDAARRHDGVIGDQPFRPVLRHQCDAIAGPDAEIDQAARQQAGLPAGLAIAERSKRAVVLAPQEWLVGETRALLEEHLRQAAQGLVIHDGLRAGGRMLLRRQL